MRFSLVLATLGRTKELDNFLRSLKSQTYKNFEVIIIDQNDKISIDNIVDKYKRFFSVKHIKIKEKGLSLARNVGLKHIKDINQKIVAFPDDDCEYPPQLLENVKEAFEEKKGFKIITGISIDQEKKIPSNGKWKVNSCEISSKNIFQALTSFTIFINFSGEKMQFFDEKLGIGAPFGSAEEMDYIYRLLRKGYKGFYYPEKIVVYHPLKGLNFSKVQDRKRAFSYSMGMGSLFKKHLIKGKDFCLVPSFLNLLFVRPIGGMLLGLLRLNLGMFLYYKNVFIGRWKGLIKYK
ncbi:glycosyltransferase family 2 protein [Desulfonauticus submarinus]